MTSRFRKTVGKSDLMKRTEESYASKDDSGKFRSYVSNTIPLKQWKCDEGDHIIDIIPFLAGANNPNGLEKDEGTHKVEVYAHYGVGVNENAYVCPQLTIGKPCPICEYRASLKNEDYFNEDLFKALSPKRRVVYQVCVYDSNKTESAGVMWWESSYHLSEKNIVAIAKNNRTGEFIPFADPDEGKTIEFTREGKGVTTDYTGFKFVDREPIPDSVLDQAVSLDDYIQILPYAELQAVLGVGNETAKDKAETRNVRKEAPAKTEEKPAPKEEEDGDVPFFESVEEESEEPAKRPRREPAPETTPEERPTRLRRRRE